MKAKSAKKKKGKKAKKKAPKRKLTAEEAEVAHAAKLGVPKNLQKAFPMLRCTACERMMEKHKKTLARMLNKKVRWNDKTQASKTMKYRPVAVPRNTRLQRKRCVCTATAWMLTVAERFCKLFDRARC